MTKEELKMFLNGGEYDKRRKGKKILCGFYSNRKL